MSNIEPVPDFAVNQRVEDLITHLSINKNRFAEKIDKSATTISSILSRRNKPGYDVLEAILLAYPQVNANWLMRGEGPMIINEEKVALPTGQNKTEASMDWARKLIDQLERENKRLWSIIETAGLGKSGSVSSAGYGAIESEVIE